LRDDPHPQPMGGRLSHGAVEQEHFLALQIVDDTFEQRIEDGFVHRLVDGTERHVCLRPRVTNNELVLRRPAGVLARFGDERTVGRQAAFSTQDGLLGQLGGGQIVVHLPRRAQDLVHHAARLDCHSVHLLIVLENLYYGSLAPRRNPCQAVGNRGSASRSRGVHLAHRPCGFGGAAPRPVRTLLNRCRPMPTNLPLRPGPNPPQSLPPNAHKPASTGRARPSRSSFMRWPSTVRRAISMTLPGTWPAYSASVKSSTVRGPSRSSRSMSASRARRRSMRA